MTMTESHPPHRRRTLAIGLALVLAIGAIYGQVRHHSFVNIDDQAYVYENPYVLQGMSWMGLQHACTSFVAANWHPLTWLSHMVDVDLFGLDAGLHHLVNVLIHLVNTLLLFLVLLRITGASWRSAMVAALFAVHPLHVESVAWVSERKDVLSGFFFLLTLAAYGEYVRRRTGGRYLAVIALFALGLLAKPMLVTLPFVLLLLDAWPLRRLASEPPAPGLLAPRLRALLWEKLPLFALAAAASILTYLAQRHGGAEVRLEAIPLGSRLANAVVSYGAYLTQTVWPAGLASFYPHPAFLGEAASPWRVATAAFALATISFVVWRARRDRPYLAVGWLWFLGMLLPVIGIVQVGVQARADRYTYLPLIGLFVGAVWGGGDIIGSSPRRRGVAAAGATLAVLALGVASWRQVQYWRDSITLHAHALRVTEHNWAAWVGLADAYSERGRIQEAIAADQEAIRIRPGLSEAWNGMGASYGRLGQHEEAIHCFSEAVRIEPGYGEAWYNLGTAYGLLARHEEAAVCFRKAVRLRPEDVRAWANLALASQILGDTSQAIESYRQLQRLDPRRAEDLRRQLGWAM